MSVIIGIDIGGTTTKIAGYQGGELLGAYQIKSNDQTASCYGALGKFMTMNSLELNDVEKIVLTGVGASYIDEDIFGIKTEKIAEFEAIGKGALYLANLDKAIIASVGTGTAIIRGENDMFEHLGGSGVGGGTLVGLSTKMLRGASVNTISKLAKDGDLLNVDLTIQDISREKIDTLPPELTAANFGKLELTDTEEDVALGLLNMIYQTAGMLAYFACKNDTIKDIVLVGSILTLPQAKEIYASMNKVFDVNFIVPDKAAFAGAIGAALSI